MKKFTKTSIWIEKEKKLCSLCDEIKHVSEFHKCSRGGVQSACRDCRREYQKKRKRDKIFKNQDIIPIINLDGEIWKTIDQYENYEISNFGRVKIKQHFDGKSNYQEKIVKLSINRQGYDVVSLWKKCKPKRFAVHRLVALHYINNPNNFPVVHHKDHNPSNNHFSNLQWTTVRYNCQEVIKRNDVYTKRKPKPRLKFEYNEIPEFLNNPDFHPIDEIWEYINNEYQISNYGRIRNSKTLRLRKQQRNSDNYLENSIKGIGRKPVHRLVGLAFISNPNSLPTINHKDGNKFNNKVENLEWSSYKENINHALKIGLRTVGENHGFAKLTEKQVIKIRKLYADGLSANKISKIYDIDHRTASNIVKRRTWTHVL